MGTRSLSSAFYLAAGQRPPLSSWIIRVGERVSALLLCLLLLPAMACIAIAIYVLSGRSPLIGDRRLGLDGQPFWMFKFRTMWQGVPKRRRFVAVMEYLAAVSVREPKGMRDTRVTSRFAALCRRYSIDELPQLWHVLQGVMSYVGPRPLTAPEWEAYYGPDAAEILRHKPGISGLWQVMGRSSLSYRQRKRLDLHLVRHASVGLYFTVLARTIPAVLRGKSAW